MEAINGALAIAFSLLVITGVVVLVIYIVRHSDD